MRLQNRGFTLIELLLSLSLGLLLILGLLLFYRSAVSQVGEQEGKIDLHTKFTQVESVLRHEIGFEQYHAACSTMLPSKESITLGENVSEAYRYRVENPIQVLPQQDLTLYDLSKRERGDLRPLAKIVGKNIAGFAAGSDVIVLTHLAPLNWQIRDGARISEELNREALAGYSKVTLYLTDCHKEAVIFAKRAAGYYEVSAQDYRLLRELFPRFEKVRSYHLQSRALYLRYEDEQPTLIIDFLDGQSFVRFAGVYRLKIWLHDHKSGQWGRAEWRENIRWSSFDALAFEMSAVGGDRSQPFTQSVSQLDYWPNMPKVTVNSRSTNHLHRLLIFNLYNL